MPRRSWLLVAGILLIAYAGWTLVQRFGSPSAWNEEEQRLVESLWIGNLGPLPTDPSNAVADDPRAAEFGHQLFFDTRLSANGSIACATCHQPIRRFTDGLPTAVALGLAERNTQSLIGSAWSPWLYWDGRKDSQWAQALTPLEDPDEHGATRLQVIGVVASDASYRSRYEDLFGEPPEAGDAHSLDQAFANVGKAIAAYERLLQPGPSRFDRYVEHLVDDSDAAEQDIFTNDEIKGLRLFIGKARCIECHNGPLFTNNEFHNTGLLPPTGKLPERGRIDGMREVRDDPFNCAGEFSDATADECAELRYMRTGPELIGATRTPSLRNLENTMPFQSKGQFKTIREVLEHYNSAPLAIIGHNEAKPLGLSGWELDNLEAFLLTLAAPPATPEKWLEEPDR